MVGLWATVVLKDPILGERGTLRWGAILSQTTSDLVRYLSRRRDDLENADHICKDAMAAKVGGLSSSRAIE